MGKGGEAGRHFDNSDLRGRIDNDGGIMGDSGSWAQSEIRDRLTWPDRVESG